MTVKSFQQYFQSLVLICLSFTLAGVLFWSIILIVSSNSATVVASAQQAAVLKIIAPLFAVVCLFAVRIVYAKKLIKIRKSPLLADKLAGYKVAIIIAYILMDAPSVFSGMCYLLTREKVLFIMPAILLAGMIYSLPRKQRLMQQLQFSQQQIDFINQSTAKRQAEKY